MLSLDMAKEIFPEMATEEAFAASSPDEFSMPPGRTPQQVLESEGVENADLAVAEA